MANTKKDKKKARRALTKYDPKYAHQAYKLALLGATREEMGDFFNVSAATIRIWQLKHDDFDESLRAGRMAADADVAERFFNRAMGMKVRKQKVLNSGDIVEYTEELPPDTRAAETWLMCRSMHNGRGQWVPKQQTEVLGNAENPLAFIMNEVAETGEQASPLPSDSIDD